MTPYYADHAATLYQGDVREALRALPAESVQTVVTSPPYWSLRDYGIAPSVWGGDEGHAHEWGDGLRVPDAYGGTARWQHDGISRADTPEAWEKGTIGQGQFCPCGAWRGALGLEPTPSLFVQHMAEVFREVRRVLRKDGTAWVNLGDSYAAGSAKVTGRADAETMPKPKGGTANDGGLRTSLTVDTGLKPKDLVGIPWRVAFALQDDGWYLRQDIIWAKPNPMPESVRDRCTKAHEYVFLLSKSPRYYFDADAIREAHAEPNRGHGEAELNNWSVMGERGSAPSVRQYNPAGRNKRSVWTVPTDPFPEAHFATFPPALIAPMILAGASERGACPECGAPWERVTERTYEGAVSTSKNYAPTPNKGPDNPGMAAQMSRGGFIPNLNPIVTNRGWRPTCAHDLEPVGCIVLDPFVGSGTTAIEAKRLGRRAIGIDLNAEYLDMAVRGLQLNRRPGVSAPENEGQALLI